MFPFVLRQSGEEEPPSVVLAGLLLREIMQFKESMDVHRSIPFDQPFTEMPYILSNDLSK
jgi:hypothetical protein